MIYKQILSENTSNTIENREILTRLLLSAGICCFVVSLFSNVFYTSVEDVRGYWVFIMGWLGLLFFQFAWYANPLNLLAFLLVNQNPKTSVLLSLLALVLASETFLFFEMPTGINQEKTYIKELGPGFFIWYLAQMLFLLSIVSRLVSTRSRG